MIKQKKAQYNVKPPGITSTSTPKPKTEPEDSQEDKKHELLDMEEIFRKKTKLEQAQHNELLAKMENKVLKTHLGYLFVICALVVLAGFVALVTSIVWG